MYVQRILCVRFSGYCSRDLYVGHGGSEIIIIIFLFFLIRFVWVIVDWWVEKHR